MVRFTIVLIPLALAALNAAPKDTKKDAKIFPYTVEQTRLDNGLNVVSIPFDSPGIIAYYTVVRTGSRNEIEL